MPYVNGKVKAYSNKTRTMAQPAAPKKSVRPKARPTAPKTSLRPKARPYTDVTPRAEKGDTTLMRMHNKAKKNK